MTHRKYQGEADQQPIRHFLQEIYLLNDRREYSWPVYRWDYWRWHGNANIHHFDLSAAVFLWKNDSGRLIGVLNPENPGEGFLQVHPSLRTPALEIEMISQAETQFAVMLPDGREKLTLWCPANDVLRQDILSRRGYIRQAQPEYQRRQELSQPGAPAPLPNGYLIRPLGGIDELPARSWVSWKAFHPNEPDSRYEGWEWYCNVQRAPLYRPDLDLVAVAPNGELAGFCTLWFDPQTRSAAFEPVGVHPAHQRKGLGKALLTEGLRRAQALGADLASVNSYSEAAGALYASAGFTEYDLSQPWVKVW